MKKIFGLLLILIGCGACEQHAKRMDLGGNWTVQIDSANQYNIHLPGSLTENGVGIAVNDSSVSALSETYRYTGEAIYTKSIEIPASWEGRPLELFMERSKVTKVYVNDSLLGTQNSVSTPHIYLIEKGLQKGRNDLKIIVDNTKSLLPLGGSHAYSEHTQTNWNGIIGNFYLRCLEEIDIRNVQVNSALNGTCSLSLQLLNSGKEIRKAEDIKMIIYDSTGGICEKSLQKADILPGVSSIHLTFNISEPKFWDEYSPYLYTLQVKIGGSDKDIKFGIRELKTSRQQLTNNGRTVFLRGKHEGGAFPLTGYPDMMKEGWIQYFNIVKSYGINHVRYHSWTPPAAAFEAADELGVFLQPELPLWGSYTTGDTTVIGYMKREGKKILETYGNHPSFAMLTLGNELVGDTLLMESVVEDLRRKDNRHLYAMGSNNFYWNTHSYSCEDFFVSMRNGIEASDYHTDLRGSFSFADSKGGGLINSLSPDTKRDFGAAIQGLEKPVIGHETGQYQIYPDFKEIKEYTGILRPHNLEIIKKRIEAAGLIEQAEDFLKASGALSALCYREEIEMALRTKGFSGFQLLDLEDYPGQGTALVGILNAFMKPKGVIARNKWTEFCNDVVPLARFSKYCWTSEEDFKADIEVANYGKGDLNSQKIYCSLLTSDNQKIYEKEYIIPNLNQGKVNPIASIKVPLNEIKQNQKLTLCITLPGTNYHNSWDIWVYTPGKTKIQEGNIGDVLVTRDEQLFSRYLKENKKILYIPKHTDIKNQSVGGLFITDFWNYAGFKQTAINMGKEVSPGTFGLLMNPEHPLFNTFPTDFHTNWQWWELIMNSRPMILDTYPKDYKPIVQVIDNWDRNHKLGLIYEMPETEGKVLVCASDLFVCKEKPEAQALFESMINYLNTLQ